MTARTRATLIGLVLLAAAVAAVMGVSSARRRPSEYRRFTSPAGDYAVVVYSSGRLLGLLPGQSGDAPGVVRLCDRTGRVLREQRVDLVQRIDQVDWEPGKVVIKLFAEWELPR